MRGHLPSQPRDLDRLVLPVSIHRFTVQSVDASVHQYPLSQCFCGHFHPDVSLLFCVLLLTMTGDSTWRTHQAAAGVIAMSLCWRSRPAPGAYFNEFLGRDR